MSDSWLKMGLTVLSALGIGAAVAYAWKESCKKAHAQGKAEGYKEASAEYEEKFRKQAEEFMKKEKEFQEIITQHKQETEELNKKINEYREEGARLIGEYEGLRKRYEEQNKKLSEQTQQSFSGIKGIWEKLKKAA